MVAVTILSLLFLLAIPTYQRIQRKAKAAALANDLRVFGTTLQTHAHEAGSWPPEAAAGIVPAGLSPEEIKYDDWTRRTPIGGRFDWDYNQVHRGIRYRASIVISPTDDAPLPADKDLFRAIDMAIDDGDLETGNFQVGDANVPLYIIER